MPDPDNTVIDIRVEVIKNTKDPKVIQEALEAAVKGIALVGEEQVAVVSYNQIADAA